MNNTELFNYVEKAKKENKTMQVIAKELNISSANLSSKYTRAKLEYYEKRCFELEEENKTLRSLIK